ncbi:hypothetical protein KR059_006429 [Drosophila kikkawai]|nr:hypothetical protein KR059_006429 [Drosophila kikkawai]
MYVIYPADELICMTYGFFAPRVKPRPTLDCLREPLVPIEIPERSQRKIAINSSSPNRAASTSTTTAAAVAAVVHFEDTPPIVSQLPATASPVLASSYPGSPPASPIFSYPGSPTALSPNGGNFFNFEEPPLVQSPYQYQSQYPPLSQSPTQSQSQSLPPTPTRRTSRASLTHSNHSNLSNQGSTKRSSLRRNYQRPPAASMYNDYDDASQLPGGSSATGPGRAPFQRSSAAYEEAGALEYGDLRSWSPSIFLEPPTPDPTHAHFGPGWGRPMSPMDLPPERSPAPSGPGSKSPTGGKSRLRPKLHLPLGRLGRSSSSDTKESNRLREDVHVHVENPVFSSENLRQNNFDAFFEAREPVIKVQPRTPHTAPADSRGYSPPLPLENYAGVYDSPRTRSPAGKGRGGSGGGGLFARSPKEERERMAGARSRSADQCDGATGASGGGGGSGGGSTAGAPSKGSSVKSSSGRRSRRRIFGWRGPRGGALSPQGGSMASYNGVLKDYSHSSLNEAFKSQNNVNFKLIKTVSDFSETLSRLYEEHATALQVAVSNYRKKNAELRKERPACHLAIFQAWETFLQEVETDSQACNDVASVLSRQVSRPMLDKSFHRKVQSRKIFTHRESFETIIAKTEEKLSKCRMDYKQCHQAHRQNPSQHSLTEYIDAHNAYVQQLHATNGMLEAYHCDTLPQQMQELEEIHNDLCGIVSDSLLQGADVIAGKASDQAKRYSSLTSQCSAVSPQQDLVNFVRLLAQPSQAQKVPRRMFAPPQGEPGDEAGDHNEMTPCLRNELVFDRHSTLSQRSALESLKREAIELELQIRQLQDSIDALNRTQTRGIEGQLYNKVNELQEDLSMKKFDLRAKQIHLAAIRAQKDLFVSKVEPTSPRNERKFSAATAPSMKTKWLKAFKSLKPAGSGSAQQADRRNGASSTASEPLRPNLDGSHHLQEYTYKKITACDVCSQILRGHTRQGLRCRICKLNAHGDCAPNLPRCQPKQKLLRRQKSTSELENRVDIEEETSASPKSETSRPFGEPLMLTPILKSPETAPPEEPKGSKRRIRLN